MFSSHYRYAGLGNNANRSDDNRSDGALRHAQVTLSTQAAQVSQSHTVTFDQNEIRALICRTRPGVDDSVMVPNCAVFTKRFGVPRFTLLSELNASPRT
jgi:hypothetical protein